VITSDTPETDDLIENLKLQLGLWEDGNLICEETLGEIRLLEERIEEALKELSSIHQWIERNHADGFIDSLTYLQNLERVTDNWYDRLDRLEVDAKRFVRERDEAREKYDTLVVENMLEVNKLAEERDEARELLASEKITRDHVIKRGIEMQKERDEAREALRDMLSGWRYIRKTHGDLYGVGWDRAQTKAEKVLEGAK
jgi:regulator of replication initiation timing